MKDKGGCFLNIFLILGMLAFALTVTYRVFFYASYVDLESDEIFFEWTGGELDVWVSTDANYWIVEDDEYVDWASFSKCGSYLHIYACENDDREERIAYIEVGSGVIKGWGNERSWLRIVQEGKKATYLNASKQMVSFSEYGSWESVDISTDGFSWSVESCPDWVSNSISGNSLFLEAPLNNDMQREGVVKIKSDDLVTEINVKQQSSLTVSISSIQIGNVYRDGRIETNYGNTLYSSYTMYLKPRINYYGYKAGWVTLYQKLYTPNGLSTGRSSPSGYSTKTDVYLYEGDNTTDLQGWGGERKGHWSRGRYRYEIWYDGKCLATEYFTIY